MNIKRPDGLLQRNSHLKGKINELCVWLNPPWPAVSLCVPNSHRMITRVTDKQLDDLLLCCTSSIIHFRNAFWLLRQNQIDSWFFVKALIVFSFLEPHISFSSERSLSIWGPVLDLSSLRILSLPVSSLLLCCLKLCQSIQDHRTH